VIGPFEGRDVRWLLESRIERAPGKEFLVWRDGEARESWTYAQFGDQVRRVADGLRAEGLQHGDAVCVHARNCPEYMLLWFALSYLGAVMVATNTRSSVDELSYYLRRSRAKAVCTQAALLPTVESATGSDPLPLAILMDMTEHEAAEPTVYSPLSMKELMTPKASDLELAIVPNDAPAGLQFTSGTTSRPKGVVWTQANYLWGAKVNCQHAQLRSDDRFLVYLPLFHANAQIYCVMPALWAGATVILTRGFSASRFWPVALEEGATWSSMIPFTTGILLRQPIPDRHQFRCWGMPASSAAVRESFGVDSVSWWGMTETISQPLVSEPATDLADRAIRYAAPEYEVRIVDDTGRTIEGPGEGLLEVKGTPGLSLMAGYYDDAGATSNAYTADGWFKTEDRVAVDGAGVVSFRGRAKDMLKIGGENVASTEIERIIGAVAGVREVAVVGAPHPLLTEVPVAFIVAEAPVPATDLVPAVLAACRERLADFKVPHAAVVVADLPRSTLQKVAKNVLREQAAKALEQANHDDR
jgi:carnitine-CoA ligase